MANLKLIVANHCYIFLLFIITFISNYPSNVVANIDVKKSIVYGPGLIADAALPARYFLIQARDKPGRNISYDISEDSFDISIGPPNERGRIWVQKYKYSRGRVLVRYRMFQSYRDIQIQILYKGKHVANSPYWLKGGVYHEECHCPMQDTQKWLQAMNCNLNQSQIERDLAKFQKVNLKSLRQEGLDRFGKHHAICHYSVISNKVYRNCYGEHVGFKMFMDAILLSLARKVKLPDLEFISNLGDWPLENQQNNLIPIFSWCGSETTSDIVMPTYDLTQSTLEMMGRVSVDVLAVQGSTGPKWKDKIEKGFWRGRDSRQERLNLVIMGRNNTDLMDTALTNFFFFKHDEALYGPIQKHISLFDFFKYKYQITLDGTVAAYRVPYILAGDSLVLKQDSEYYEHFYKDLKAWTHYVPIKRDLSDLIEKIKWAKNNDKQAKTIAQNAQQFVLDNLLPDPIFCYHWQLFNEYSKRLTSKPRRRKGMERVKEEDKSRSDCNCERKNKVRDEL
ncbi:KDEL motif-containing protein 1 [Trichoplax sp. H2]|nr:KDEL motif-containing protein 1 [Trichoplax sp. H2]|eukprot:RDD44136.1 KDEL motif-containing protein 1 [Trichoplax sp. H2]